jgi:hypothetical protein
MRRSGGRVRIAPVKRDFHLQVVEHLGQEKWGDGFTVAPINKVRDGVCGFPLTPSSVIGYCTPKLFMNSRV